MKKKPMIHPFPFWCATIFSGLLLFGCAGEVAPVRGMQKTMEQAPTLSKSLEAFVMTKKLIFVLSDKGCGSCNDKMVKIASSLLDNEAVGVVLETTGNNYDVSSFLSEQVKQSVREDFKSQLSKLYQAKSSFVLFSKGSTPKSTDEIVEITTSNMEKLETLVAEKLK